jgi:teichuronic acid biosynthesis glycosyltransferase TuaC
VIPRLLFLSNLFPTVSEPYRGLDNATLLHALTPHFEIRVLSPRPTLPWRGASFPPRPEDAPLQPHWIPTAYLPKIGGPVNHLLMATSLRQAFEETLRVFHPAIILSSWIYPDSCAAVRLAAGRIPVVAIAQGSDIHQYLTMPARRRVILKYLPQAAAVITRSRELSRLLEDAAFPPKKLHTVYNGVSLDTFQPRDQALARREAALQTDPNIILFVGNFYPVKNPLLLIQAFSQLTASPSPLLVMAGAGPLDQPCRDLATQLGIASRVIFAGRKTPPEIARLMNAADLLAIPSKNEGVPNVILEAFASGLPVVASRVGGIPEVLDRDFLGRTFPTGDCPALVTALHPQLTSPRNAAAIRQHAERFSWPAAATSYREILLAASPLHNS